MKRIFALSITLVMMLALLLATAPNTAVAKSASAENNYKILIVYVTEVNAWLTETYGSEVSVNYVMSEVERRICELIPVYMSDYLNDWFDGFVDFSIDSYFTTRAIGSESIIYADHYGFKEHQLWAFDIVEMNKIIDDYDSVITVFSMEDYNDVLHCTGGMAGYKYAYIHLESVTKSFVINNEPLTNLLDYSSASDWWKYIMDLFIHEFTHTVDQNTGDLEYHSVLTEYTDNKKMSNLEATRLFLLGEAEMNGKKAGIPIFFWNKQTVIPNLDSASSWAHDGVRNAITKGFVPDELHHSFQNIITRAEFCRMAVKWLEYRLGKSIDKILAEKGLSRDLHVFGDTHDPDILAAYALGITSGTLAPAAGKAGLFTPNGEFSREQAATMIRNTCKAAGMDVSNITPAGFEDISNASNWAVDGINFCYANNIMIGTRTSPLQFSPKTTYTREQSIMTFNNIEW